MYLKINNVKDLSKVDDLKSVLCLDAANADLEDCSFLSECTRVKRIYLSNTGIKSLTGIEGCKDVELVSISCCPSLRDLTPLKACEKLKELYMYNMPLSDAEVKSVLGDVSIFR